MNAMEAVNQAKDVITVRRVYGEPYQDDGLTIIPAAKVTGGGGGGGDTEGNGGVGFGVRAVQIAERTIGQRPGTGGTSGVSYLAEGLENAKAFPELWAVRTRL